MDVPTMFTAEAAAPGNCAERAPALERVERGAVTTSTASEDGVVEKREHDNHNTLVSVHESNRSETPRDEHHEDTQNYSSMVAEHLETRPFRKVRRCKR